MRALKETRRYWLPLGAAVLCLYAASLGFPPIVAFVLIVAGVGLCLDAATTWLERTSSTGGMHDYKQ